MASQKGLHPTDPRAATQYLHSHLVSGFAMSLHGMFPPHYHRFGAWFNQRIEGITWPTSLKQLTLGSAFNQPIAGAVWPESLQQLSLGEAFNQAINTTWPANGPRSIVFERGSRFNCDLETAELPVELEELTLACHYNNPIVLVKWPASLRKLAFGTNFN